MKRPNEYDNYRPTTKRLKKQPNEPILIPDPPSEQELIRFSEPKPEQKFTKHQITPWMTKRTRDINDSLLRFHNQIIEFCEYVSPTDSEHKLKQLALEQLTDVIKSVVPECEVQAFGSFATGLYLPDGDVDVAVVVDTADDRRIYELIHSAVLKCPQYGQIQYIRKSKVPLIKLLRTEGGIQFDISVNKQDGIKQIVQVRRMMDCYPEFRYMAIVLKCTLKVRGLGETYSGGLGSFLLFSMLLVYLREMQKKRKYYTLSEHVLRFMEYYALSNDWSKKRVYVSTGETEERRDEHTLSFISPQDDQHDIGKSAFRIKDVFGVFKNRFRMILGKNFKRGESVLKELVNPNEAEFLYSKDR